MTYPTERFQPGQQVMRAGDPGDNAYLVLEGRLEVYLEGADGAAVALSSVEPGQFVGELALIDGVARSAHVRACPEMGAVCAVITAAAMQKLLGNADPVVRALLLAYARRLRATTAQAVGTDAGLPGNVAAEPAPLLIVTDNKNVAAMVCTPVLASRVRVLVEPSGIKALNMVQSGLKPQVVVASATSLDMEGGVLAKMLAIRDLASGVPSPKGQRIPFILLASHGKKAQNFSPKDVDQLFDLPDDAATLEQYLLRLLR